MRKFFRATGGAALLCLVFFTATLAQDIEEVNEILTAGSQPVTANSEILTETFDNNDFGWAEYNTDGMSAAIGDGDYRLRTDGFFNVMGFGPSASDGLIVQVDTIQLSDTSSGYYGLVCRLDQNIGTSYEFAITNDGFYHLYKNNGDDSTYLIEPTESEAINIGAESVNQVMMICVNDYLALYVNNELLAETNDQEFTEGQVGFHVGSFEEGEVSEVAFDNLAIWNAEAGVAEDSSVKFSLGEPMLGESFDNNDFGWAEYDQDGRATVVEGGYYILSAEGEDIFNMMGFGPSSSDGIFLQAETILTTIPEIAQYGLACRLDQNVGSFYQFTITNSGTYYIYKASPDNAGFLVEETESEAINTDIGAINVLGIVCVEDYLAFFVNDTLVADAFDSELAEGQLGLHVYSGSDAVEIYYDNLLAAEATVD